MSTPKDMVDLTSIKHQIFQNDEWQWVEGIYGGQHSWVEGVGPPYRNSPYMSIWKIPNASKQQNYKVRGHCVTTGGTWIVKLRSGKNPENSVEYTVIVQADGHFEIDMAGLNADNDFNYVWVSFALHDPANPKGLDWEDCIRIETVENFGPPLPGEPGGGGGPG